MRCGKLREVRLSTKGVQSGDMQTMTSRERVLRAIRHQEPDRVPLDIGGGSSTGIVVEGDERLKRRLGVTEESAILSRLFRVARTAEPVLRRLGSDCRPLTARPPIRWTPPIPSEPGTSVDEWGITWRQVEYGNGCFYWELAKSPLAEATEEDLVRYPWPDPCDPGRTDGLADEAKWLFRETEYAIVADGGFKSFWELGYMLRGLEQMLMDVALEPDFVAALLDRLLEINLAATGRFLDAVGPYIQVFRTGDDLASQEGPLMSPAAFRSLIKPRYKRYLDFVRSRTDAKIFFHSCGNVVEFIDDLADCGVDILNPVQVSAMGDTAALKARFGGKIVFWGGVDTQRVLPYGIPADVESEVRRRIRDLAPGGGYVLAAVHNIQPDVPTENILAMADATHHFGQYPIVV
jgi:uroporphyrinogen decarboxylase